MTDTGDPQLDAIIEQLRQLLPEQQLRLAEQLAANVGYVVTPEPQHPDSPHPRSLIDRLLGPHEWGYRDPVEGGFIEDGAPFEAAERLSDLVRHALR